jgi:hypothetical protein
MKWSRSMPVLLLFLNVCQADEGLFDADPNHPWNRLHRQLHTRTLPDGKPYSPEGLEPNFVRRAEFLTQGESHRLAIQFLDDFLEHDAGKLIADPLKRAILQRDLWAIFVTVTDTKLSREPKRRVLQKRLAQVMRTVALTEKEIDDLPNNLAATVRSQKFPQMWNFKMLPRPFLPGDLLKPNGPWVSLRNRLRPDNLAAPIHVEATMGRSAFLLFLKLPDGRKATLDYVATLESLAPDTPVPQIPIGTHVALQRRMLLIDQTGTLRISPVTESLQMRVTRELKQQDMYEYTLRRKRFFEGLTGGLRPTPLEEENRFDLGFLGFELNRHLDPLDERYKTRRSPVTMKTCIVCHGGPGIFSFQSLFAGHFDRPPLGKGDPEDQVTSTIDRASETYTWGLLQGLWESKSH